MSAHGQKFLTVNPPCGNFRKFEQDGPAAPAPWRPGGDWMPRLLAARLRPLLCQGEAKKGPGHAGRKADLYDFRAALKSKGLVRQYGER